MTREELEVAIDRACWVAGDPELVVIGSQSILAQFPNAPPDLLLSREVDVFPKNRPERSDLILCALGELSPFHQRHRFYVDGVGPETAVLPEGWAGRLVPVHGRDPYGQTTDAAVGWCLEAHDAAASKLVAGREKDLDWVRGLLRHGLADAGVLERRVAGLPVADAERARLAQRVARLAREAALERRADVAPPPIRVRATDSAHAPEEPPAGGEGDPHSSRPTQGRRGDGGRGAK